MAKLLRKRYRYASDIELMSSSGKLRLLEYLNELVPQANNSGVRNSVIKLRDRVGIAHRKKQIAGTQKMIDKRTADIEIYEGQLESSRLTDRERSGFAKSLIEELEKRAMIYRTRDAAGDRERAEEDLHYAVDITDHLSDDSGRIVTQSRLQDKIRELGLGGR